VNFDKGVKRMQYQIAEIFHSVQGEGRWTGTPMMFVRLAGCNVGRYAEDKFGGFPVGWTPTIRNEDFHLFQEKKSSICETFDGQKFLCDTDYHSYQKMTAEEVAKELHKEDHVCITGGEPFLHNLVPLMSAIYKGAEEDGGVGCFHIETSGTLPIKLQGDPLPTDTWITCCPKHVEGQPLWSGIWETADEWKVLVGPQFEEKWLWHMDEHIPWPVEDRYLQPINGVNDIWKENLDKCLDLLTRWPHWKLSAQLHKYIGAR
jgi:7-carboxy-7-deazaguanine synthase